MSTEAAAETLEKDPVFKVFKEDLQKKTVQMSTILGRGSYSMVYKGEMQQKGKKCAVAVKIIDTRPKGEYVTRFLPREIGIVRQLKHANIACTLEIMEHPIFVTFLCEFCEGGDLLSRIQKVKRVPEAECKFMFRQLIEALMYLQKKSIVHRDLKCENIFLDKSDNVKLGDFGFARTLAPPEESNTFCGSRAYVAPEILQGTKYTGHAVDVWSCGVILYVMASGLMPFDDSNPEKMLKKQLEHKLKFPRSQSVGGPLKEIIKAMLNPQSAQRPNYAALIKLAWLKDTAYAFKAPAGKDVSVSTQTHSIG